MCRIHPHRLPYSHPVSSFMPGYFCKATKAQSMTQINPYLTFSGNCREAMTFYQECLGGELTLLAIKDSPMASQWPAEMQSHILHAGLVKDSLVLLGSDISGPEGIRNGNSVSLSLMCSSEEEINTFASRLSKGGRVTHPLHAFFDGMLGVLVDKYGMNWILKL